MIDQPFLDMLVYTKTNDVSGITDPSSIFFASQYTHSINTFKNTPDQTINIINAININGFNPAQFDLNLNRDTDTYFEIVSGYPRNHYTHKRQLFSTSKYSSATATAGSSSIFIKGSQTVATTIGENGIDDGTFPIQSINVNNVNIVNSENVIQQ